MRQATSDLRLKTRIDYIVDQLAECQQANGNGWVGAIPDGKKVFARIAAGDITTRSAFDLDNTWVPWYAMHKVFAGLIDACERGGNAKAKDVVVKLGDWCAGVVQNLNDAQLQQMLSTEQGGMVESLMPGTDGPHPGQEPGDRALPGGGARHGGRRVRLADDAIDFAPG